MENFKKIVLLVVVGLMSTFHLQGAARNTLSHSGCHTCPSAAAAAIKDIEDTGDSCGSCASKRPKIPVVLCADLAALRSFARQELKTNTILLLSRFDERLRVEYDEEDNAYSVMIGELIINLSPKVVKVGVKW